MVKAADIMYFSCQQIKQKIHEKTKTSNEFIPLLSFVCGAEA